MVKPMMNSSNYKLSKRLAHFAQFYQAQDIVWDIGCDHGQLGLHFLTHSHAPQINLVDPAKPVIDKLKEKVLDSDIPRTAVFHSKGQDIKLDRSHSHFIFIAGMGGSEIIEILSNIFPQLKVSDLVFISPHTKVLDVRHFLRKQGDVLLKEGVLCDHGIWYPYFLLGQGGESCTVFGESIFLGEEGENYKKHLIEKLSKHRDKQSKAFLNFLSGL